MRLTAGQYFHDWEITPACLVPIFIDKVRDYPEFNNDLSLAKRKEKLGDDNECSN